MATQYGIYGVKSDQSRWDVTGREDGGHTQALKDAYAANWGVDESDISVYLVPNPSETYDRIRAGDEVKAITWDGPEPTGNISGVDWTTEDSVKFGLRGERVSGKQPDANDGVIYLRDTQQVVVKFEVWNLVNGIPSTKTTLTGPQRDVPLLVDGISRRAHITLSNGEFQITLSHHANGPAGWTEIQIPQPGYRNTQYVTFDDPVVVRNSIEPGEF